ncbi:MAG: Mucin-21 [Stictis urceolatum]|nr:Mucin-21 [Stictis urceolata]
MPFDSQTQRTSSQAPNIVEMTGNPTRRPPPAPSASHACSGPRPSTSNRHRSSTSTSAAPSTRSRSSTHGESHRLRSTSAATASRHGESRHGESHRSTSTATARHPEPSHRSTSTATARHVEPSYRSTSTHGESKHRSSSTATARPPPPPSQTMVEGSRSRTATNVGSRTRTGSIDPSTLQGPTGAIVPYESRTRGQSKTYAPSQSRRPTTNLGPGTVSRRPTTNNGSSVVPASGPSRQFSSDVCSEGLITRGKSANPFSEIIQQAGDLAQQVMQSGDKGELEIEVRYRDNRGNKERGFASVTNPDLSARRSYPDSDDSDDSDSELDSDLRDALADLMSRR